jgi:hypothetical protein
MVLYRPRPRKQPQQPQPNTTHSNHHSTHHSSHSSHSSIAAATHDGPEHPVAPRHQRLAAQLAGMMQ